MSTPSRPTADQPSSPHPGDDDHKRRFSDRIPRRLLGGRLRTTTAVLVLVFVGLLALYGQQADHYKAIDEEKALASAARAVTPRTTQDTPEYTEPTRTSRSSVSSSAPSTSSTSTSASPTNTDGDGAGATTTTTAPGFQFPTIPGVVLPGQTPTTTPAR